MNNDQDSLIVQSLLRSRGLQADLIARLPENKTPDMRVVMPEGVMLIEVKSKEDDKKFRDFLKSPKGTRLSYYAPARTRLKRATSQIHNYPDRKDTDFTLIWFMTHKQGGITVLTASDAMGLLYGIEHLQGYTEGQQKFYEKDCFFFGESIFITHKYLDGVVLHDLHPPVPVFLPETQPIRLCLNPYSYHYSSFKSTCFVEMFKDLQAVIDPLELEAVNQCFIADCDISRRKAQQIVDYLRNKYNLNTVEMVRYQLYNNPVR